MKRTLKNFAIYSVPDLIGRFLPFFTLPITTAYLTLQDFGNIALFSLCVVPFTCLTECGSGYIIFSSWFRYNKRQQGELLFILAMLSIVLHIVAILIISVFYESIFSFLMGEGWKNIKDLYGWLVLMVLSQIPSNLFNSWVIIQKRAALSSSIQILAIGLGAAVLLSITVLTQNYRYIIMGNVAVACTISLIKIAILIRTFRPGFKKEYLSLIFRVGSPMFFRSIFNQARKQIDRFYIANLWGASNLALYNFSSQFNNFWSMFGSAFDKSYQPDLYEQLASGKVDLSDLRRILFLWFYGTFLACSLVFILGEPVIALLTHGVFIGAYPLMLLFSCCVVAGLPFLGSGAILVFHQKTSYLFLCTVISSAFSLLGCVTLIPKFGAIGGIVSIWIGVVANSLLYFRKKQELFPNWIIEKTAWSYVLVYHFLVTLRVLLEVEVNFLFMIVVLIFLTVHGYVKNKSYIIRLYHSSIRPKLRNLCLQVLRSSETYKEGKVFNPGKR